MYHPNRIQTSAPTHWLTRMALAAVLVTLGACASRSLTPAPVEDRSRTGSSPVSSPSAAVGRGTGSTGSAAEPSSAAAPSGAAVVADGTAPAIVRPPPLGIENAGKPGYYTVKSGETLIRIGLDNGQNWRDIVRWNALANPNQIEVGQVLRVIPPVAGTVAAVRPVAPVGGVATGAVASGTVVAGALPPAAAGVPAAAASTARAAAAAPPSDEDIGFIWPASGAVLANFDGEKNKGVDIGGKLGDPIVAAADGQVVYAGAGLRTYGNLIILKHNNTYLTAYAHNQLLLVKEDQTVRKGQKIAEMGQSDTDRVKLHFEVRRMGTPINPIKMLPVKP